jgi:ABC-type nitrate/sulfonate/bicarbonate transport system ATPase subunit
MSAVQCNKGQARSLIRAHPSRWTHLIDVNLTVEPGEFVSLIGPSGCGKSNVVAIDRKLARANNWRDHCK